MKRMMSASIGAALCFALAGFVPAGLAAQSTLTGQVVDNQGNPIQGVQVSLSGTTIGSATQENGRYLIQNIPAGIYTVSAQRIGFARQSRTNVNLPDGERITIDFEMSQTALSLQEIRVAGLVDPLEGMKTPFTVGKISADNMQIPQTGSALNSLSGKVAGVSVVRGGGQPGSGVQIRLRTPTSIEASNTPLFILDGVILSSNAVTTSADLEAMDIESIEVLKGASAATLYGSRAAAGAVIITTRRGSGLDLDQTQINARTEIGFSDLPLRPSLAQQHRFRVDPVTGEFLRSNGDPITSRGQRSTDTDGIQDNAFPGPLFDNLTGAFSPGVFNLNTVSVGKNTSTTNFLFSYTRHDERGAVEGNEGFTRNTFRLNLDHRIRDDLSVAVSASHVRGQQDDFTFSFDDFLAFEPDVNILARDSDGNFLHQPDPTQDIENPLWEQANELNVDRRTRTFAALDGRWNPLPWLRLSSNFSYDQGEFFDKTFTPRGLPVIGGGDTTDGSSTRLSNSNTTFNGFLNATLSKAVGDLNGRLTVRGSFEDEKNKRFNADGSDLFVGGIPTIGNSEDDSIDSTESRVKSEGYLADLGLDYQGKYIGDFVVRRDGSSLFGADARWNTFYRASAAYLISEEEWWPFESITDFKARYAIGTAGGRPGFNSRFDLLFLDPDRGLFFRSTKGNVNLQPEITTEQDIGIDLIVNDKYSLQLSYVQQETVDQILTLNIPAATGFTSQTQNRGSIEGKTYEATLEANFINSPDVTWTTTIVADRSQSKITDWPAAVERFGFGGLSKRCQGCDPFDYWGQVAFTSFTDVDEYLTEDQATAVRGRSDEFQINDDGFLVWVGPGNDFTEGVEKSLWNTRTTIEGKRFDWGEPIFSNSNDINIGSAQPDVALGWLNNVRYKGLNIHTQFQALLGFEMFDDLQQDLTNRARNGEQDQGGKPEGLKKTHNYYLQIRNGGSVPNTALTETISFLKLRTLSLNYTLREDFVSRLGLDRIGADQLTLGVVARNLFTIDNLDGFDPEAGSQTSRTTNNTQIPQLRQFTFSAQVIF